MPGVFPFYAFIVLRLTLQARKLMRPIVVTIVAANVVNAMLNWILIYGRLGAPRLGIAGSAWATTVSRWLMMAALLALAWHELRPHLLPWHREVLEWPPLARMLHLEPLHLMDWGVAVAGSGLAALLLRLLGPSSRPGGVSRAGRAASA